MNKLSTFIVLAGIAALGACASDEAMMNDDEDMAAQPPAAAAPATAAPVAAMPEAATEDEEASSEESASEPADAATTSGAGSASYGSGNLVSACVNGDQKRVISVVYDNETTGNVCEVTYEKSTGVQTLWSAQNDRDYCLDKAQAFVEKQKGWGWTCSDLQ